MSLQQILAARKTNQQTEDIILVDDYDLLVDSITEVIVDQPSINNKGYLIQNGIEYYFYKDLPEHNRILHIYLLAWTVRNIYCDIWIEDIIQFIQSISSGVILNSFTRCSLTNQQDLFEYFMYYNKPSNHIEMNRICHLLRYIDLQVPDDIVTEVIKLTYEK